MILIENTTQIKLAFTYFNAQNTGEYNKQLAVLFFGALLNTQCTNQYAYLKNRLVYLMQLPNADFFNHNVRRVIEFF